MALRPNAQNPLTLYVRSRASLMTVRLMLLPLTVTVDYSLTLSAMIEAGHYDFVYPGLTFERFPIDGTGIHKVEVAIVGLDRNVDWPHILNELQALGLRPARLEHLLALGAQYPNEQRKYAIDALGTIAPVGACGDAAFLYGDITQRGIKVIHLDEDETVFLPTGRHLALR
jgi:hypothetical protein